MNEIVFFWNVTMTDSKGLWMFLDIVYLTPPPNPQTVPTALLVWEIGQLHVGIGWIITSGDKFMSIVYIAPVLRPILRLKKSQRKIPRSITRGAIVYIDMTMYGS